MKRSGERFDALIVGAGPAGSLASEMLARGGARVALFDGRPHEEAKACGGGVTSKALKAWPFLLEAEGRTVSEVEMRAPSGKRISLELPEPFAIYSRRALDSHLRERARRAGAKVFSEKVAADFGARDGGTWKVRSKSGSEWAGSVLVGADGASSQIARRLSGPLPTSEMEVAFGYRAPLTSSREERTVIAFLPGWAGYAWAFPRLDHISFGIATAQDTFDHKELDRFLWEFIKGYYSEREGESSHFEGEDSDRGVNEEEGLEERLRASVNRYAARIPGLSAEALDERKAAGEDWALLGDAAGFADPVTGEGIYYALRSAELFAEAFLRGDVASYERAWRADFGRELRRAARMRRRFYGSFYGGPFTDRMILLARSHPGIRRTLRELVGGEQGYLGLKRTLARRALWPF